jgi:cytochrome c biogenesis protein CcmG, thiol:disulfide interchange protein DsbE
MYKLLVFFLALGSCITVFSQNELPVVNIKTVTGQQKNFSEIVTASSDTVLVVSMWANWCIPCLQELESISNQYEERQKEKPFKLIAVSIDDARTAKRVRSFAAGKGWQFDIYLDTNSDLKRALNVNDVPHLLIIKNGKIVHQQNGYVPGNEEELFEKIKSL